MNHTKLFAAIEAELKLVVEVPVVVLVTVIPLVTTSVPALDLSELCRMLNVTEGEDPLTTDVILLTVIADVV